MSNCNKCQKEINNDNSYTLNKNQKDEWGRIINNIYLCESCFKNNEATYMKEYVGIVKGSSQVIKELKPKNDEGQETNYFECKKCGAVRNYETASDSELENGCPNCQSKDFELKISLFNGDLHFITKECPKCHKMDMAELLKWPDDERTNGKSKAEVIKLIKQENLNNQDNCQCSHNEDNSSPNFTNQGANNNNPFNWTPWLIGGGIIAVIGIVAYFWTKKNKRIE